MPTKDKQGNIVFTPEEYEEQKELQKKLVDALSAKNKETEIKPLTPVEFKYHAPKRRHLRFGYKGSFVEFKNGELVLEEMVMVDKNHDRIPLTDADIQAIVKMVESCPEFHQGLVYRVSKDTPLPGEKINAVLGSRGTEGGTEAKAPVLAPPTLRNTSEPEINTQNISVE